MKAHEGKAYPLDKMEMVVDGIVDRHPSARFFLFGGGSREAELLKGVAERHFFRRGAST